MGQAGERVIFSPPLLSRFKLVLRFEQNVAFASLGSLSACYAGYSSVVKWMLFIWYYYRERFLFFHTILNNKTCKQKRFHGWCDMEERILREREVSHLGRFKCFTLQPDSLVASNQVQYVPCSRNRSLGLLGYACCQTTSRFRWIQRARNRTKSCKRDKGQTLKGAVFGEWQIPTGIGGGRSYKERNLGRVSSNKQRFSYTETTKK